MFVDFEEMQGYGTERIDAVRTVTHAAANGLRTIASETADYVDGSLKNNRALAERLINARTLDEVLLLQSSFARRNYAELVDRSVKISKVCIEFAGGALLEFARETCAPLSESKI